VIPSKRWVNRKTGRTASIYGAQPWSSPVEEADWEIETVGWTVRDNVSGTVGIGRIPWTTQEEAQAWVDKKQAQKKNPVDSSAAMYESFHGTPSTETVTVEREEHYHGHLAELGVLVELQVETVSGLRVTLSFAGDGHPREKNPSSNWIPFFVGVTPEQAHQLSMILHRRIGGSGVMTQEGTGRRAGTVTVYVHKSKASEANTVADEVVHEAGFGGAEASRILLKKRNPADPVSSSTTLLTSNESGTQLYFVGGDQELDLAELKLDKYIKDSMVIGDVTHIVYRTAKDFDKFEDIDYIHEFSEDSNGPLPELIYDTMNCQLSLSGGCYRIEQPLMKTSPGIEN